jgi:hypothetical protein
MGVDRRKHDVDIIERVLGGIRESHAPDPRTRVDVDVPSAREGSRPTLEVMIGIDEDEDDHRRGRGRS